MFPRALVPILLLSACTAARDRRPNHESPDTTAVIQSDSVLLQDTVSTGEGRATLRATFVPAARDEHEGRPPEVDGVYRIIWGRDSILVRAGGTGLRYGDSTPLSLPLPPGFAINDLKWVPVGHDLLVFYEATDMDGATSFAARLDGTTLAIQWLDSLIGFNLGTPILDSTSAFVANISILARLDLTTGAFLWRVDDFYRVSGCDAYDYPTLRADSLILRCSGTRPDYYHRRSGQLLRRGA